MRYTIQDAATTLKLSPQRVRQLAADMTVERVGNVIVLTPAQLKQMARRNLKPGPKTPKKGMKATE